MHFTIAHILRKQQVTELMNQVNLNIRPKRKMGTKLSQSRMWCDRLKIRGAYKNTNQKKVGVAILISEIELQNRNISGNKEEN